MRKLCAGLGAQVPPQLSGQLSQCLRSAAAKAGKGEVAVRHPHIGGDTDRHPGQTTTAAVHEAQPPLSNQQLSELFGIRISLGVSREKHMP